MDGEYVELPVCWSYCVASELACVTSKDLAEKACTMGVAVRLRLQHTPTARADGYTPAAAPHAGWPGGARPA